MDSANREEVSRELEGQQEKRDAADFALWKAAPPEHIMRWKSPWGEGFPGWHIECSAMATKYLGPNFDIHGGGMDLLFPHHESEIAQSTICNHANPVNYWMHNNMITINGRKMGKSYNNVIKLTELFSGDHPLLSRGFHPMTVRFFILQSHYRSPLDFSDEALQGSEKAFKRLWEAYENLKNIGFGGSASATNVALNEKISNWLNEMEVFMDDDFSTPKIIANLFEIAPTINSIKDGLISVKEIGDETLALMKERFETFLEKIFGLKPLSETNNDKLGDVLELLLEIRKEAKQKKDFATSDNIRNKLNDKGIIIKDEKDGNTSWSIA
jgi:cysteinyl-tRNA synthetase